MAAFRWPHSLVRQSVNLSLATYSTDTANTTITTRSSRPHASFASQVSISEPACSMDSDRFVVCWHRRHRRVLVTNEQQSLDSPTRVQPAVTPWTEWKQPPVALHREFKFSLAQSFAAIVIYALLLTDVWRTGLGVSQVRSLYKMLEPGLFVVAGPWETDMGLVAAPSPSNDTNASERRISLWDYKSDTSSHGMRAVATFLQLPTWPQCVFHRELQCPGDPKSLGEATVFKMLDALVDGVRLRKKAKSTRPYIRPHGAEGSITLRVASVWKDRAHDFILPKVFSNSVIGTTQALYYSSPARIGNGLCSMTKSSPQPYTCNSLIANYNRLAKENTHPHKMVATIFTDRVAKLQASYPTAQIDFLLVGVREDASKGALSFQGRRIFATVLIARVRNCTSIDSSTGKPTQCTTALIDEFRVEGVLGGSNGDQWYHVVASLRVLGQGYTWLRLLTLLLACHQSMCADPRLVNTSRTARWKLTLQTFFVVPSYVVAYSNLFSIICYAAAHIIDSSMTYEILAQTFNTPSEFLNISFIDFFLLSSVQMRNIWLLTLAFHLRALIFARRCWTPSSGMMGIAEFVISGTSALTIFAQFRRVEFRDVSILSVQEIPNSARISAIKAFRYPTMSSIASIVKGTIIDFKCLGASLLLVCGSAILLEKLLKLCSSNLYHKVGPFLQLWTCSWLPSSAEYVWPARAQIVTWHDANIVKLFRPLAMAPHGQSASRRSTARVVVSSRATPTKGRVPSPRNDRLDPLVYLTNLVMMSDPITFTRLRWMGSGVPLCFFRCKQSARVVLIPLALVESEQDVEVDWENDWTLLARIDSRQIMWSELLRCGGESQG